MDVIESAGDWLTLGQHSVPLFFDREFRGHDSLQKQLYGTKYLTIHFLNTGFDIGYAPVRVSRRSM